MLPRVIALLASLLALAGAARAEAQVVQATFSFVGLVDPPPTDTAIGVATVNGSGGGSHIATIQLPGDLLSLHTTVSVTGRLSGPWIAELERSLGESMSTDVVVLDLTDVSFVDREGIEFLRMLRRLKLVDLRCSAFVAEQIN